jgi:poly(beta-D-mannuronate) lyase
MHYKMNKVFYTALVFIFFNTLCVLHATTYKVQTVAEFKARVDAILKPNDTVLLANGTWRDAELVFKGQGTESNPSF